jgi:hypothetical protein
MKSIPGGMLLLVLSCFSAAAFANLGNGRYQSDGTAVDTQVAIQTNVYSINRPSNSIPCQTRYPAAKQVGQTWIGAQGHFYPNAPLDGGGYSTDPVYIWGNGGAATKSPTFVGLNQYAPDECGNGQRISDYVQAGHNYRIGTLKPDYAKFPYPIPCGSASKHVDQGEEFTLAEIGTPSQSWHAYEESTPHGNDENHIVGR